MLKLLAPDLDAWGRFVSGQPAASEAEAEVMWRWRRATSAGAPLGGPAAPGLERHEIERRLQRLSALLGGGLEPVYDLEPFLETHGLVGAVADPDGRVLSVFGGGLAAQQAARVGLGPGHDWSEGARGTNGIGTALAENRPVAVLGGAHFQQQNRALSCYAAPILDPSGRPLAVLAVAGPAGKLPLDAVVPPLATTARLLGLCARQGPAAADRPRPREADPQCHPAFARILGSDPRLTDQKIAATKVARVGLPALLLGQTGTGKELFARSIHEASPRRGGPFVAVNCAAIPRDLLESELFGYADGAFSGARRGGSRGKIAAAHGGTLFLDEISDMPGPLQALMLRVLEDGSYYRVGDSEPQQADLRLTCATSQDIEALVAQGKFRKDLFFRIRGAILRLPALAQRSDLSELIWALLHQITGETGAPCPALSPAVLRWLLDHPWPGNVRELKMVLRYALALAGGEPEILPHHLPDLPSSTPSSPPPPSHQRPTPLRRQDADSMLLRQSFDEARGNLSEMARLLGVARSTVYRLLRRHHPDLLGHRSGETH